MTCLFNSISSLWVLDLFYKLCLIFDSIIYTIAGWLFNTFYDIAGMSIVDEFPALLRITDRLNVFIGIFALFLLVKSLLINLSDPDRAINESSKIVKNIVMGIVLLISVPLIFDILNGFQSSVIESNAIPKLVMNDYMMEAAQVEDGSYWTMNNIGNVYMNNVFLIFFRYEPINIFGYIIEAITSFDLSKVITDLSNSVFGTVESAYNAVREGSPIISLLPFTNSSDIRYEYPIISGIVGLIFCYYFFKIAISLGIRMFKLFLLQIIAPIPIILSIDPSQSLILKNYFNYLGKTYVDLFIRLMCVMLAYPLGITIVDGIIPNSNLVIELILVIALLKFAKDFPKVLSEIFNLNIKLSDKGPGGFLGGLFGTGVGLASGAIVSKNVGLKGKDFALHTLATGFKGGVSGYKGGQQGVVGFGKSVVGGMANSYVDATQIYSTGGYGNWLKAQMYEKTGQSRIFAQQREKLSDAVTNTNQHYDSLVEQQKRVGGLKKTAQDLYNETYDGGMKYSEYQDALKRRSDALKNGDTSAYSTAVADLQRINYDGAVADFYNNASVNSTIPQAVTLASIKDQINSEISDVDPGFDVSMYNDIDNVAREYSSYVNVAKEERNQAIRDLQEFKKREDVQIANYKLENNNRYMAGNNGGNRSNQRSSGRTGTGQQGQGQTGSGQQNPNSSGQAIKNPPRGPVIYTDQNGEKKTTSGITITTEGDFQKIMRDRHK